MSDLHIQAAKTLKEVEAARNLTNESWLSTYSPLIGEDETQRLIAIKHSRERFQKQFHDDPVVSQFEI